MYAVIRVGSKQYRVSQGDSITVEKLPVDEGKKWTFDDVLLCHDGKHLITDPKELKDVKVKAKVTDQGKDSKVLVFKYKPKKGYRRKKGHRQMLTRLTIEDIIIKKKAPPKKKAAAKKPAGKAKAGSKKSAGKAKAAGKKAAGKAKAPAKKRAAKKAPAKKASKKSQSKKADSGKKKSQKG